MGTMSLLTLGALGGALLCAAIAWALRRGRARWWRRAMAFPFVVLTVVLLGGGAYSLWYHHRLPPDPLTDAPLFQGVTYTREVLSAPRPIVAHVVRIDLDAPGIEFLVTPPAPVGKRPLEAKTCSQFLRDSRCQLAINAMFFYPWRDKGPWDYYPHAGDGVNVVGPAVSRGKQYSWGSGAYTLAITRDNRATIGRGVAGAYNAISASVLLVDDGRPLAGFTDEQRALPAPRTAAAVDREGRTLLLFVIDGRQPNYSEGMTLPELAALIVRCGGWRALNLDGGGSSCLVIEDADGNPRVLNSPIHNRVPPGRQRPVANHLGVFAQRKP